MTALDDSLGLLTADTLTGAQSVARGVARMFLRHDVLLLPEVSLRNRRRGAICSATENGRNIWNIVIGSTGPCRSDSMPRRLMKRIFSPSARD